MRHRKTITIPKDKETIFREALKKEEATRTRRYEEAYIEGDLPEIVQNPPPDWIAPHEHRPWWKIFNLLLI